jgi:hypothetical protein
MKRRILLYCCLALMLAGCAPPWRVIPKSEVASGQTYKVDLPAGWMQNEARKDVLFISLFGPALQGIEIREAPPAEAFKKIHETVAPGILPSELAELKLALIKNELSPQRVVLLENKPALIDGHQGYRLQVKYENSRGLGYEAVVYGFTARDQVYMIRYYGTSLYYFPHDLPVFEGLVKSFRLTGG